MTKANKYLSTITFILAGALTLVLVWLFMATVEQSRQNARDNSELKAKVTSLEADIKNTKEVLDEAGYEDLNI